VQIRSILEHKAEVITKVLAAREWIQPAQSAQYQSVYLAVLSALRNGGDYKLMEQGNILKAELK
jgi:hypothetical protein